MLRNGSSLPTFALTNQRDVSIGNDTVIKQISIICFHRGVFCPTTDRFLASYQDFYGRLKELSIGLYFISNDSVELNKNVSERLKIKFDLLADTDLSVARSFDCYIEEGGSKPFSEPALFITDIDGKIAYQTISSGPKGLPAVTDVVPVLLYMKSHGGKY
jgi:peroxiredoxin